MARVPIRIHHLSDVHFGNSEYRAESKLSILPSATQRNATAYLSHLERLEPALFPDLVVISGDFATYASEAEMDDAEDFIAKITAMDGWAQRARLPAASPRVLIVPGNHDLDWAKESAEEKHERYAKLSELVRGDKVVLSSWYRRTKQNPWFDFGDEANLFVYLLNSTPFGGTEDPVLKAIYSAITATAGKLGLGDEALKAFRKEVTRDPGFIQDKDLDSLRQAAAKAPKGRTRIAIVHHNPNHVPSDNLDTFDTIVNGGALKAALLEAGFHIVLHGHRHIFHCSAESHPGAAFAQNQCFFVSADSLGCKEHAPFLELQLSQEGGAQTAQGSRIAIREFSYTHPTGYGEGLVRVETALVPSDAEQVALKKLQDLQYNLSRWTEDTKWIHHFHFQLQTYGRLWATALYDNRTLLNPVYQRYLREQYTERFNRQGLIKNKVLYFSPEVKRALTAHGWRPSQELWSGYKIEESDNTSPSTLEIARIMIVDSEAVDLTGLENLAYDHSLCAIPLFVIERKHLKSEPLDFAIGMDAGGVPQKACAYDEKAGAVVEQTRLDSYDLIAAFEQMLTSRYLRTAYEFVGRQRMWVAQAGPLTKKYADARKASSLIVDILNRHLPERGETGLDLCCGTGNYTAPVQRRFRKVIGVDISPEMIEEAKKRVPGVEWVVADAKDSGLPAGSCDAVWMISALHYFLGDEQLMLFREIHRILKPGGVFIADTEFLEQHPSLWIVDYFPSLKNRYQDSLFGQDTYRDWLGKAGFGKVVFETHDYKPEEGDRFLRIGQHKPALYLDKAVRDGIPAFQLMDPMERKKGLERLADEITTGETMRIRQTYMSRAQSAGDVGIITATKPA